MSSLEKEDKRDFALLLVSDTWRVTGGTSWQNHNKKLTNYLSWKLEFINLELFSNLG